MMTSTTTLALGTSAGTLVATVLSALVVGALGMYTLLHHKQVFAWMKKIQKKGEESAELSKPSEWVDDLYRIQCGLGQKPCRAADFEELTRIGNMIKGVADHMEIIRLELLKIVERVEDYVATDLPDPGINTKVSLPEHRMQLVRAMKQEAARTELARAIITAQQKIKTLRRS